MDICKTQKTFKTEYKYTNVGGGRYTNQVSEETFGINNTQQYKHAYNYGKTGNLVSVYKQSAVQNEYTYDKHNRLVWEHNYALGEAIKYFYDSNGNITQRQVYGIVNGVPQSTPFKTDIYDYTTVTADSGQNPAWRDQLKSYNGSVIKYDDCGNPTGYNGRVLSWQGNRLVGADGVAMEYDYNGLRIKKGNKKYYRYGDKLVFESDGTTTIYYYYDESGISGISVNVVDYFFKKNVLGDVEEIYDKNGVMQCRYVYDAWGNHRIYDVLGNEVLPEVLSIGNTNPIRYRGYYWDRETKLYYLQSRYYDPEVCRFISPDGVEYVDPASVCGFNLYAYCNDNPVMNVDPSGHSVILTVALIAALIGATIGGTAMGVQSYERGERGWDLAKSVLLGITIGTAVVGAAFTVVGATASATALNALLISSFMQIVAAGIFILNIAYVLLNAFFGTDVDLIEIPSPPSPPMFI